MTIVNCSSLHCFKSPFRSRSTCTGYTRYCWHLLWKSFWSIQWGPPRSRYKPSILLHTDIPICWAAVDRIWGCRNQPAVETRMANSAALAAGQWTSRAVAANVRDWHRQNKCFKFVLGLCLFVRRPQVRSCSLVPSEPWPCWARLSSRVTSQLKGSVCVESGIRVPQLSPNVLFLFFYLVWNTRLGLIQDKNGGWGKWLIE